MKTTRLTRFLIPLAFLTLLVACGKGQTEVEPPEIRYGETECLACRMIISDPRFAAGYTYQAGEGRYQSVPFDDVGDMLNYAQAHPEHQIVTYWVHDFETESWIRAEQAFYVFSHNLETPMAFGTAAADSREKAQGLAAEYHGQVFDWDGLLAKHRAGELAVSLVGQMAMGSADVDAHFHATMHAHDDQALVAVGEADAEGYHLTLLARGPLHVGYNRVMLHLANPDGATVTQAEITFHPLMHMPTTTHAAPVEQPGAQVHLGRHFGGAVGFPMPSGPDLGDWELGVTFSDPAGGVKGKASFPIEVAPSELYGSFVATDNEDKIFLMVVAPQMPGIGLQPIEIAAVQKQSAMEWPPLDDLTLAITPEMPTMGHSSADNEHPTSVGGGHYLGQVNFNMAGPWTVTVVARRDGVEIGQVVFEFDVR